MAIIKLENRRTGSVFEISHYTVEQLMESHIKYETHKAVEFPLKFFKEIKDIHQLMKIMDSFRYSGIDVNFNEKVKNQSYNGLIFNTLIHSNEKNTIVTYIFNELQRDIPILIKSHHFNDFYEFINIEMEREKKYAELQDEFKEFQSESVNSDEFYAYLEDYQVSVYCNDVKVSKFIEKDNFFENFKKLANNMSDLSVRDFLDYLSEEDNDLFPDLTDDLTKEEENEIIDEKCNILEDSELSKYFFENNYNIFNVLSDISKKMAAKINYGNL